MILEMEVKSKGERKIIKVFLKCFFECIWSVFQWGFVDIYPEDCIIISIFHVLEVAKDTQRKRVFLQPPGMRGFLVYSRAGAVIHIW